MFKNAAGATGTQPTSGEGETSNNEGSDDIQDADFDEVK